MKTAMGHSSMLHFFDELLDNFLLLINSYGVSFQLDLGWPSRKSPLSLDSIVPRAAAPPPDRLEGCHPRHIVITLYYITVMLLAPGREKGIRKKKQFFFHKHPFECRFDFPDDRFSQTASILNTSSDRPNLIDGDGEWS